MHTNPMIQKIYVKLIYSIDKRQSVRVKLEPNSIELMSHLNELP